MKSLTKVLAAASLSAMMGLSSLGSAVAMPLPSVAKPTQVTDVQSVQWDRRDWRDRRDRREWREDRRDRREWRERRAGYYGGHRGYRDYRRGYRRHSDGFWYPLAAFGAGAIVGGAVTSPRVSGGSSHVQWCTNRYRSYRAYDNTYVPRAGVRAQCNSPYS